MVYTKYVQNGYTERVNNMAKFKTSPPVKKQWLALMKKEERFINTQSKEQTISISDKIEKKNS